MNGTFAPLVSDVVIGDVDRYVVSFRPSISDFQGQARIDKNITRNTRTNTNVFHDIVQRPSAFATLERHIIKKKVSIKAIMNERLEEP